MEFHNLQFGIEDEDAELIPLISAEDEENINNERTPEELPILPLRNTVLFPGMVIPITVGRDMSIKLINDAHKGTKTIGVIAQRDAEVDEPTPDHLYQIGTLATILKLIKMPDGNMTVVLQGKKKFTVAEFTQLVPYFKARVSDYKDTRNNAPDIELKALEDSLKEMSTNIINLSNNIPSEAGTAVNNIDSLPFLTHFIASNLNAPTREKQEILEIKNLRERAEKVLKKLDGELQAVKLKNDIQSKVKSDLDKQQREYILQQQMKQIQDELGANPIAEEIKSKKQKALGKKWPEHAAKTFEKEIARLERTNTQSAEYGVQNNYLDVLLDLPWDEYSTDNFDLRHAKEILDRDHFGLEKVKERIIEHLAVLKLKGDMRSPIICLYGPPGVGKTSLGKSVAEALGRKYVRMSLGGLRDEAEIRGHRKTYIGAMPGRVLQNLKKVGTGNPLFVLDEIDKLSRDAHGDPSSAMLEVLDPEQNHAFHDNYVDLDYDLSKVMFIATANNLGTIQPPLRDRMEIIELTGYTTEEKAEIAKRHLIPKQFADNGVAPDRVHLSDEVIQAVIEQYTNESGVRGLEKRISKIIRHRAKQIAMDESFTPEVQVDELKKILGLPYEKDRYTDNDVPGVVTGLAWTPSGGDILFIETALTPGEGKLSLTGNLGDVMKESATIALAYLKAHSAEHELTAEAFEKKNVHIHVPQGATPKDGPSAGITMLTALASIYSGRKVKKYLAMTGEITLRGKVLPVGGIKEKILAAKRAGIKEIILCERNRKDIDDIEASYLSGLTFHFVTEMSEVLHLALE